MINLKIGSDAEFLLYKRGTNNFVNAYEILENSEHSELGIDGENRIAEIRPEPTSEPLDHAKNIFKILESNLTDLKNFRCEGEPQKDAGVGGHIHFGSEYLKNISTIQMNKVKKLLDFYLALPLCLSEFYDSKSLRGDYCRLSSTESKDYGFEYRNLNSWLTTKKLTKGVLCLAFTIMYNILNSIEKRNFTKDFSKDIDFITENHFILNHIYTESGKDIAKPIVKKIYNKVKKFKKYNTYKQHIDYIFKPNQIIKDKEKVNYDILAGWHLISRVDRIKKMATLKDIKKFKLKNFNEEEIENADRNGRYGNLSSFFSFSDDFNIINIKNSLLIMLKLLKIEPKQQYRIYGIAKNSEPEKDFIIEIPENFSKIPKNNSNLFNFKNSNCEKIRIGLSYNARLKPDKAIKILCQAILKVEKTLTNENILKRK